MEKCYRFEQSGETASPALIYYKDRIEANIKQAASMAGGPSRLWPHVKTHKMGQMIRLQLSFGISRFKCATIAEAEMAAEYGAGDVLLSYPLVGPNIKRFLDLSQAFPDTAFWAIGDNREQLRRLGGFALARNCCVRVLADVNTGMNRTGVSFDELFSFYRDCACLDGIELHGLHCYDGNRTEKDESLRRLEAEKTISSLKEIRAKLTAAGLCCGTVVLGGTPSFPCYRDLEDVFLSPGTLFVNDHGYTEKFPDLSFPPAAAVLTRVISHPGEGRFTLDLGYKGIASDPASIRGKIVGLDHVKELFQSEEHWTFSMEEGYEAQRPEIGRELFVIPTHICPTTALYPCAVVVSDHQKVALWQVTARNRSITY